MTDNETDKALKMLSGADVFTHGHLPVAAAYCRRLGLVELVNRLVPTQMHLKPGLIVQAMVLDTLSGRTPLYRVEDFMAEQDVELILGEYVAPTTFNDTNLARSMDAMFEAGPSKIITELGICATSIFALDATVPSYDTTSTSVWGDYRSCEREKPPSGPLITQGHSKDYLPQFKQFMTELLCVDRGVPIFGGTLDGNASDKTSNNRILSKISSIMARHGLGPGAFVYVADSAVVTEKNLIVIGLNLFVSRLPATYNECERAITEAVASDTWVDIGKLAEIPTGSTRPCASYKVFETTVELHGTKYRAVVVHSSSHDKRRKKKLDKAIADSEKSINAELTKLTTVYFCEADAKTAARQAENLSGKLHTVKATVSPIEVRKPGRPPANGPARTTTRYSLSWNLQQDPVAVEREKSLAGCFVLVSNVPIEGERGMDGKKLLQTYKGQYGVEADFAFLKDPIVVNDIFLKKPSRIEVLGMVLIISLMVWRLMERSMRVYAENKKTDLPGWCNRRTKKPTSFMMTTALFGIKVALIGDQRVFLRKPRPRSMEFVTALGLDESVFLASDCRCQAIIPLKSTTDG
jgi:transposase